MSDQRVREVKPFSAAGADDMAQEVRDYCGHTVEAVSTESATMR